MATRGRFEGSILVGWAAAALALMTLAVLVAAGTGEDGVRTEIRATARTSLLFFALAFGASGLRRLWRAPASAWLLRNRRYLGLSFAVSHALHGLAIVELALRWPEGFARTARTTVIGGSIGYIFVAALAATSNDRAVAWLGRRRWRALHLTGCWVLWAIFAASYLPAAAKNPHYLPAALLVLAAPALRATARLRQGEAMCSRSPSSSSAGQ